MYTNAHKSQEKQNQSVAHEPVKETGAGAAPQYPKSESFAAARQQTMLWSNQKEQSAGHYGTICTEDASEFVARLRARLPRAARPDDWLTGLGPESVRAAAEQQPPEPPPTDIDTAGDDEKDFAEHTYITNAGIVLLAPFLPRLFTMLGLTDENAFVDPAAAERAAHLLQFIVTDSNEAPEFQLALNKLLCGIPLDHPLERQLETSESEREAVSGMLDAVIEHWGALRNTSQAGLRSSFLQREGRLEHTDNGWHLLVNNRAFDLLLDSLPWSYKLIRYAWMDEVLHVDWR